MQPQLKIISYRCKNNITNIYTRGGIKPCACDVQALVSKLTAEAAETANVPPRNNPEHVLTSSTAMRAVSSSCPKLRDSLHHPLAERTERRV